MKLKNNENLIILFFIILVLIIVINKKMYEQKSILIPLDNFKGTLSEDEHDDLNRINLQLDNSDGSINIYGPIIY